MKIELLKWNDKLKSDLIRICNEVDRSFLSDRMPYPYTEEDATWWLDMVRKSDEVTGLFRAISIDGKIVGNITVEQKSGVMSCDGELGYFILDEYKGQGIMTDVVNTFCSMVFEKLNLLRITLLVYSPNIASKRVAEKNGFVLEGIQKKAIIKNGNVYDLYLFGKVK